MPSHKIIHITDLEGQQDFLQRTIDSLNEKHSTNISLAINERGPYLAIPEDVSIVYGGDLIDKGLYDLELLQLFNNTKATNPEALTLIAGNREINKLRFVLEVTDTHPLALVQTELYLSETERQKSGPARSCALPWVDGGKNAFITFLSNVFEMQDLHETKDHFSTLTKTAQKSLYLQWMLAHTMGSPQAWQFRKDYLAQQNKKMAETLGISPEPVSDETIYQSFADEFSENGPIATYLKNAVLMKTIGNTLFIHGGFDDSSLSPKLDNKLHSFDNARDLEDTLNEWFSKTVNNIYNNASTIHLEKENSYPLLEQNFDGYQNQGELIEQYNVLTDMILPERAGRETQRSTVITNDFISQGGVQVPSTPLAKNALDNAGIYILVAGHMPHIYVQGIGQDYKANSKGEIVARQCIAADSSNYRENLIQTLVIYQEMLSNGKVISSVSRFSAISDGNDLQVLLEMKTPGIDSNGILYKENGQKYLASELDSAEELQVGRVIKHFPSERLATHCIKHSANTDKLTTTNFEITGYTQGLFLIAKAGGPGEGFQNALLGISAPELQQILAAQPLTFGETSNRLFPPAPPASSTMPPAPPKNDTDKECTPSKKSKTAHSFAPI